MDVLAPKSDNHISTSIISKGVQSLEIDEGVLRIVTGASAAIVEIKLGGNQGTFSVPVDSMREWRVQECTFVSVNSTGVDSFHLSVSSY